MSKIAAGKDLEDTEVTLNDVDKVLTKMNISLKDEQGQIRDLDDVLDEVAGRWDTFTTNEKNQISTAIAGTRQANYFKAAMADWGEVLDGTQIALDANGTATERMGIYTESLGGKIKTLKATWEEFVADLNLDDVISNVISTAQNLLEIFDTIINKSGVLSTVIKGVLVAQGLNILSGAVVKVLGTLTGSGGLLSGLIKLAQIAPELSEFASSINSVADAQTAWALITGDGILKIIPNILTLLGGSGGLVAILGTLAGTIAIVVAAVAAFKYAWENWLPTQANANRQLEEAQEELENT
jgi:hypothetical protein